MQSRIAVFILCLSCLCSCVSEPKRRKPTKEGTENQLPVEATGFTIQKFDGYRKVTVVNPWQKSNDNLFDYYLVERGSKIPEALKGQPIFFTPLQKVICLSTTHVGFLDALGETASLSGLSGCNYISNPEVKKGIEANRIREVGYERGLNYEMILQLKPDVVFAYGVGSEISVQINKLRDLGIPVVLVGEYLEKSPLAKAEWIKFFGAFFAKEAMADSVYNHIKSGYEAVKSAVSNAANKPNVLTGLPFKDTWWMAGGQSNLAVLISDAGGKFLWQENSSSEAFPVSLEEVFLRAATADYWINCGIVQSKKELITFDARFSELSAVQKSQVYNNNLRSVPGGGNDYWESGVVRPDLVLADMVRILHPELSTKREFFYYRKIE